MKVECYSAECCVRQRVNSIIQHYTPYGVMEMQINLEVSLSCKNIDLI